MGDDLDFSKILQEAEQLTAEIDTATDLPRVQRNLRQITEAGQLLLGRSLRDESMANAETKASIFLGSKGVDITKLSKHLTPVSLISSSSSSAIDCSGDFGAENDIEVYLKQQRTNAICAIAETTLKDLVAEYNENVEKSMEQEWKLEKQRLLAALSGSFDIEDFRRALSDRKPEPSIILGKNELTYAHLIDVYNKAVISNLPKPNLLERMDVAAKNTGDKNVQELWAIISALVTTLPFDSNPSALERRANPRFNKALISRAKQYLEKAQFSKLQGEVWKTFGKARAGSPTVITLVRHYIETKNISSLDGLEVGAGDCGPVWVTIYFCLRSGKIEEAVKYLRETVGNGEFAAVLEEYAKCEGGVGLPKEMEAKIRVEYQKIKKGSNQDPFKRVVYALLGACDVQEDHSDVANRLDDYLWLKLSQVREVESLNARIKSDLMTYADLQKLILETYGESHFDAFKQPFTYFQALILTGQFEAAIEFLSRVSTLRSHGVHMAIVLNEMNLLITCDPQSPTIVRVNDDPPGLRRLNYCNLVSRHAKSFQGTNTKEALNYMYFLRNIKEHNGASFFSICVSELAVESREFTLLFGTMNSDGCRTPGILETMGLELGPQIEHCAKNSEDTGHFEDAVILFDLAGNHEKALKILSYLLSTKVCRKPLQDSMRQRVQKIAITLAERYQNYPTNASKPRLNTFYLLVDFMTFFDEFHSERIDNALVIIDKMKVVPLDKNDTERCINNFHTYADEIRMNIPDLILATMESLFIKYKKIKTERSGSSASASGDKGVVDVQMLNEIKAKSKSLVTYCGLIPYYMNEEMYTKVMQIEVQMN